MSDTPPDPTNDASARHSVGRFVRLRAWQKRRAGYEYRYKQANGWSPWLPGDEDFYGLEIMAGTGVQHRAPRLRKPNIADERRDPN